MYKLCIKLLTILKSYAIFISQSKSVSFLKRPILTGQARQAWGFSFWGFPAFARKLPEEVFLPPRLSWSLKQKRVNFL